MATGKELTATDYIAHHLAGATHARIGFKVVFGGIAGFSFTRWCQMIAPRGDVKFGKVSLFHQHLALATGLVTATDRLDLDAQPTRRFQQGHTGGNFPLATDGLEDHFDRGRGGAIGGRVACTLLKISYHNGESTPLCIM